MQAVQFAVDAVSLGGLYAMLALGLALLFGVMGIMNFAYGELIMVGGYALFLLQGQSWPVMVIGAILVVVMASIAQERIAFRPVREADLTTMLVTAFAVSILLQNLARMTVGPRARGVRLPGEIWNQVFIIGGVRVSARDVITMVTVAVLLGGLTLLLTRTHLGLQLRAAAHDFRMARLLGVRANTVIAGAFAITGVLAGVASILFIVRVGHASPTMGLSPLLVAFVGTVLGGMNSLVGSALGGFLLGTLITALHTVLPAPMVPYRSAIAFALVILILLFRPQGVVVAKSSVGRV